MPSTRKAIDDIEDKYKYLPLKKDVLRTGKCAEGPCIAYRPNEFIFCVSTELPALRCPLFKRKPQISQNEKKAKVVDADYHKQLSFIFTSLINKE